MMIGFTFIANIGTGHGHDMWLLLVFQIKKSCVKSFLFEQIKVFWLLPFAFNPFYQ